MPMPGRTFSSGSYRYGFNGKENDNEVKGTGNQQDYGMRIYDPRLGRFLSRDPLANSFPALTPYQFAANTPIQAIDLDGGEPLGFMEYWQARTDPYMTKWGYTVQDFYDYETKQVWTVSNYPNTNQYFYWQTKYEGANALFSPQNTNLNKGPDKDWTGTFKQFIPHHQSEIADGACNVILGGLGVGVATPFIAAAGVGIVGAAEGALTNLATQTAMTYYRWAPTIGIVGRQAAGLLDESGGVGLQNSSLTQLERSVISEAQSMVSSNSMQVLKNAFNEGVEASVEIGGRTIHYNPDLDAYAMTLHQYGEFVLGKEAFRDNRTLAHTVLWELYRLATQGTSELSQSQTRGFTDAAQEFANRAIEEIK